MSRLNTITLLVLKSNCQGLTLNTSLQVAYDIYTLEDGIVGKMNRCTQLRLCSGRFQQIYRKGMGVSTPAFNPLASPLLQRLQKLSE
ncbi:hypothetical protein SKAU_G00228890 [Synaphobranchus kaupii]|uniref:Uncharacterized protein n=1 Tax=Synaphobranchus kaupii TaxID=118154 RepID=A0A9Q1IR03_SYNKA|nr:hypothetical protein SKAU_G00228890 [Synaphobranchus kaupii]